MITAPATSSAAVAYARPKAPERLSAAWLNRLVSGAKRSPPGDPGVWASARTDALSTTMTGKPRDANRILRCPRYQNDAPGPGRNLERFESRPGRLRVQRIGETRSGICPSRRGPAEEHLGRTVRHGNLARTRQRLHVVRNGQHHGADGRHRRSPATNDDTAGQPIGQRVRIKRDAAHWCGGRPRSAGSTTGVTIGRLE